MKYSLGRTKTVRR